MEIVWDDILNNVPWDIRRMFKDYEDKISFETKYHLAIALPFAEENKLYMNALIYSLKTNCYCTGELSGMQRN